MMINTINFCMKMVRMTGGMSLYRFGGLSATFLQTSREKNTEIISLTMEEVEQLSSISHYSTSVQFLTQNNLNDSFKQLQFALSQAKNKFPWSINLQACLMNRMSILVKLLNRKKQFQTILQELYLISLSSKGPRSLDTIKNLINYLICLTTNNYKKCNAVLEFLSESQKIPDYVVFFDALNDIRMKESFDGGIQKLKILPQGVSYQKIFKYNNLAFMKIYCIKHKNKKYYSQLLKQSQEILSIFLNALLQAENNHELVGLSQQDNLQSDKLKKNIKAYLQNQTSQLLKDKVIPKNLLKHSNSHIISMNIASLLFDLQRLDESTYFLKLSLEKAISDNQLQRIGSALILLGRCYYLQGEQKWQQTFLEILQHSSTYPTSIIKQTLSTYSKLLFKQGRTYQAENYLHQSLSLQVQGGIEGLILPNYDFSF